VPLAFVGNDQISAALFPLTPTRALCAGAYDSPVVLDTLTRGFFGFAATASWNFVVQPPSYPHQSGGLIGGTVTNLIVKAIEEAVAESLTDM